MGLPGKQQSAGLWYFPFQHITFKQVLYHSNQIFTADKTLSFQNALKWSQLGVFRWAPGISSKENWFSCAHHLNYPLCFRNDEIGAEEESRFLKMHNLKMSWFFLKEHIGKSFFYYAKQSCVKLTDKDTDFSRKMC